MFFKKQHRYRLDNSGIIHLAVHTKNHSNIFRLSVALKDSINPTLLQKAFDLLTPRFPMLVAGIQNGFFHHYVIPVENTPVILPDSQALSYMTKKQIKNCAMRVLYDEHHIAVEFFHSLTDGYGGSIFLKSLLSEYMRLAYGIHFTEATDFLVADSPSHPTNMEDSFLKYAGETGNSYTSVKSYQLKNAKKEEAQLHTTTIILDVNDVLSVSRYYKLTLTEFLTALMADAIMGIQAKTEKPEDWKTVEIMVPVNFRRFFPSTTLRNFSLYTLSGIQPEQNNFPLEELASIISKQQKQQLTKEHLSSMITTNVRLEKYLCWVPLKLKCIGLHFGFHLTGSRNSCITISNLGNISLPESLNSYISEIDFMLTPRICSGYNCAVVSCNGQVHIIITRTGKVPQLEPILLKQLENMGFYPEVIQTC